MTIGGALLHPHKAPDGVKRIYDIVEGRDERVELNLYITGTDEDNAENPIQSVTQDVVAADVAGSDTGGAGSSV